MLRRPQSGKTKKAHLISTTELPLRWLEWAQAEWLYLLRFVEMVLKEAPQHTCLRSGTLQGDQGALQALAQALELLLAEIDGMWVKEEPRLEALEEGSEQRRHDSVVLNKSMMAHQVGSVLLHRYAVRWWELRLPKFFLVSAIQPNSHFKKVLVGTRRLLKTWTQSHSLAGLKVTKLVLKASTWWLTLLGK